MNAGDSLPSVAIDDEQPWWKATDATSFWGRRALEERFFPNADRTTSPIRGLDLGACDVEQDCEIIVRANARALTADSWRSDLWMTQADGWFEATVTLPSGTKEYDEEQAKNPTSAFLRYVLISFSEDSVEIGYQSSVSGRELLVFPAQPMRAKD